MSDSHTGPNRSSSSRDEHGTLVERFLLEELATTEDVDSVRQVLRRRTFGEVYLAFNVFNLRLDFDAGSATVEDELDPTQEQRIPLDDFAGLIQRAWRRR